MENLDFSSGPPGVMGWSKLFVTAQLICRKQWARQLEPSKRSMKGVLTSLVTELGDVVHAFLLLLMLFRCAESLSLHFPWNVCTVVTTAWLLP
ncbi:uncharacterized protein LOC144614886 isoform X2 [Panthera onca]